MKQETQKSKSIIITNKMHVLIDENLKIQQSETQTNENYFVNIEILIFINWLVSIWSK